LAGQLSKLDDLLGWVAAVGGDAAILPDGVADPEANPKLHV
jgi:hypothetical protein